MLTATSRVETTLLDIALDVDGYVAAGGQLLQLKMIPNAAEQASIQAAICAGRIPAERAARVGKFTESLGNICPTNVVVGALFSEAQLRGWWHEMT